MLPSFDHHLEAGLQLVEIAACFGVLADQDHFPADGSGDLQIFRVAEFQITETNHLGRLDLNGRGAVGQFPDRVAVHVGHRADDDLHVVEGQVRIGVVGRDVQALVVVGLHDIRFAVAPMQGEIGLQVRQIGGGAA